MTAKRKTGQPRQKDRTTVVGKKAAKQSINNAESHPKRRSSRKNPPRKKEPKIDRAMRNFSRSLHNIQATLAPSEKFKKQWMDLLRWHEEKERERVSENTGKTHAGERLVQRRWAVLDRVRNTYDYLEKLPLPELHPIPIVVVNWHGTWDLSPSLRATVTQHPIYRALEAELPEATPKNNLLHHLQWAMSLSGNESDEDRLLASLAHECDALIHDVDMFNSPEDEWLLVAREQDDFWKFLQTVFDFGRRHAFWQTYRDGTVSKSSRKGLLMAQKGFDQWSDLITIIISAEHKKSGLLLTASQLRKALGADHPPHITRIHGEVGRVSQALKAASPDWPTAATPAKRLAILTQDPRLSARLRAA